MRSMLLGCAAAAAALAITAPARAEVMAGSAGGGSHWGKGHHGGGHHGGGHHGKKGHVSNRGPNGQGFWFGGADLPEFPNLKLDPRHRIRHGRFGDRLFLGGGYYRGYLNDRTFEPDSYNDWWHDRPDRAYPRWVQNRLGRVDTSCAPERMWWAGGGWRC